MELAHQNERHESALEDVEHDLYDPKNKMEELEMHHVKDRRALELPTSWGENSPIITQGKEDKGMSFGMKFLISSLVIFVCAIGIVTYRVISLRNVVSGANIDMTLETDPYIEGGASTPLNFTLFNRNKAALQSAVITLVYNQGLGSQDEQEKVQEKRDLGAVDPNAYKSQDFKIVLYGSEAEQRNITLKLEYKVAGSNAVFSKVITTTTVLKTPPIAVHIDGPQILSVGQNGTFVITVNNNSATTSLPSVLQVVLPNTFSVVDEIPNAISRSTAWSVPPIAPGSSATTTIIGSLSGTSGETTSIRALIGSEGDSRTSVGVVYSSQTVDVKLRTSPLNFVIALDTDSGVTEKLRYGDKATLTITYANTSDVTLQDVSIKLSITGDAPLLKKIDPSSGYYDSAKQTITWDKSNLPDLATMQPHANGTLQIVIPIVTLGTNSPLLKVNLTGSGSSQAKDDVVSTISKSWAVQGSASIYAETKYKDSPFANTGPIPPQPNTDTTYTAHLSVSAQNALVNTRVSFILPTYVTWRNMTSDPTKISFDERSRTVTWLIGDLGAEKTTTADISLSVKPSQSHVNQSPPITSGIVLDADEDISKAHIRTTISALTTYISGENWSVDPSRVIDR